MADVWGLLFLLVVSCLLVIRNMHHPSVHSVYSYTFYAIFTDADMMDDDDDDISPDLWQEACWIVIRFVHIYQLNLLFEISIVGFLFNTSFT